MKRCYYELSRRQILVIWYDGEARDTASYPRTEAGQRRANAKLARLQADGYAMTEAPKDWYTTLIEQVRTAQETPQ